MKSFLFIVFCVLSLNSFAQDLVLTCDITDTLSMGKVETTVVLNSRKSLLIDDEITTVYGDEATFVSSNGDKYNVSLQYTVQGNGVDLIVGNSQYYALSGLGFLESEMPSYFSLQVGINNSTAPYALLFSCRK